MTETYVIHVTKKCNMRCLYCYETDKESEYTWEEVKRYLDTLLENRTANSFGIEFLGGEPMLAWGIIKQAYEYLEGQESVDVQGYAITTNGTVLPNRALDYLSKNKKFTYSVSLDGHRWANQFRILKQRNQNSYHVAAKNIKKAIDAGIKVSVHIVTHPYNVAYLRDSIVHLYEELGVNSFGIGTIESTMKIDKQYCRRFVRELDEVSDMIINGELPGVTVHQFESVKPLEDVRTYLRDDSGKVVGETYGRSGNDVTATKKYSVQKCKERSEISKMIYYIRETVYLNHQVKLKGVENAI